MSKEIFSTLIAHAESSGVPVLFKTEKRYITKLSDDDAQLMSSADVEILSIGRTIRLIKIFNSQDTFFLYFWFSRSRGFTDRI